MELHAHLAAKGALRCVSSPLSVVFEIRYHLSRGRLFAMQVILLFAVASSYRPASPPRLDYLARGPVVSPEDRPTATIRLRQLKLQLCAHNLVLALFCVNWPKERQFLLVPLIV